MLSRENRRVERVHWQRTQVHWTEGKVYRKMELFLTVEGTDGVGILRQRNAIHKIPKFPHVVSHRKREKTHFRSRATCYVVSFPASLSLSLPFCTRVFVDENDLSVMSRSFAAMHRVVGRLKRRIVDDRTRYAAIRREKYGKYSTR